MGYGETPDLSKRLPHLPRHFGQREHWPSRVASTPRQLSSMRLTVFGEPVPSAWRIFSTVGLSPAVTSASAAALTCFCVMPLAMKCLLDRHPARLF